jgi:solute carrier family 35, member F5
MSALEPPFPPQVAAISNAHASESTSDRPSEQRAAHARWRYALGLLLLAATVLLWTASNFLASTIFADNTFSKPYFVTYINSSFFVLQLIPILGMKAWKEPDALRQGWAQVKERAQQYLEGRRRGYKAVELEDEEEDAEPGSPGARSTRRHRHPDLTASEELLLGAPGIISHSTSTAVETAGEAYTLPQTLRVSLEFCFIWFLANYFVAACLSYTTVASATILTSTSSVFTLLFGAKLGVESFTLRKSLAVAACLLGVILIAVTDMSGSSTDEDHRGDFPEKTITEIIIGDVSAAVSAVMYGLYAAFLKKRTLFLLCLYSDRIGSLCLFMLFGIAGHHTNPQEPTGFQSSRWLLGLIGWTYPVGMPVFRTE